MDHASAAAAAAADAAAGDVVVRAVPTEEFSIRILV